MQENIQKKETINFCKDCKYRFIKPDEQYGYICNNGVLTRKIYGKYESVLPICEIENRKNDCQFFEKKEEEKKIPVTAMLEDSEQKKFIEFLTKFYFDKNKPLQFQWLISIDSEFFTVTITRGMI